MRHYLRLKIGRIPRIGDVYKEFKAFALGAGANVADLVADVCRYSRYDVQIALRRGDDAAIQAKLDDINTLKVDTAYPLLDDELGLLELMDSYGDSRATRNSGNTS